MRRYNVDVPVRVQVWSRPECQRKQWNIIKQAAPSILFLISDGGRNPEEMQRILESRTIVEDIDWDCQVFKQYYDTNQGLYTVGTKCRELIFTHVDRCIFLEDDQIPSVSFFRFCAELLERYKDDKRIEMIAGCNPFEIYEDPLPHDYFFTESGWSIWGTACWKRTVDDYIFPLEYSSDTYIRNALKDNLTPFWYKKAEDYCNGKLNDNHVPGAEYYHAINSALFHRLSIVPTRNMISNIGTVGTHANIKKGDPSERLFNMKTYEINGDIVHPKYVIDDKKYGEMYSELLGHESPNSFKYFIRRCFNFIRLVLNGEAVAAVKRKMSRKIET